jgi:hypothetical protein
MEVAFNQFKETAKIHLFSRKGMKASYFQIISLWNYKE